MSDASEADRQEQQREVRVPEDVPETPSHDPEVPEADAVEQAMPAPLDDDELR
ncbi:MAG: hypothetical protein ACRD12_18825 [Acidimicrobiales bacterium]